MSIKEMIAEVISDLKLFAATCLKVMPKEGALMPLRLNRAQLYIHRRMEDMKLRTGKVRVIILKGRQQGACLTPDTRVLTADLRWVQIGSLAIGDEIVATDEHTHVLPSGRFGKGRKMRTATVQALRQTYLPTYLITLDDGRTLKCSGEHRWLVRNSQTQWSWRSIDGPRPIRVGWKLRSITTPWGAPDFDDGWFGGMIDGEGSFERRKTTGGLRLAISQRAGAVFDRMVGHCQSREFGAYVIADDGERKTKFGNDPVYAVNVSSSSVMFRLFGLSRPTRFIGRRWWEGMSMPDNGERTIVSIEPIGPRPLVDIQTSTKTFIAEGIVSHNSTYVSARFFYIACTDFGKRLQIMAHLDEATKNLFSMIKRYHSNMPPEFQPVSRIDNANELTMAHLDTTFHVSTAGSKGTGRSSSIQYFHWSEVAFSANPKMHMAGIGQCVPDEPGTEIVLESTANGIGNLFHTKVMDAIRGRGGYELIFVPWFWETEYTKQIPDDFKGFDEECLEYLKAYKCTKQQVYWRYCKIIDDFEGDHTLFDQEYPATVALAFMAGTKGALIDPKIVHTAMEREADDMIGEPLVLGCDPAEYGDDESAFCLRRGRKVIREWAVSKEGNAQIAGRIGLVIEEQRIKGDPIDAVFIDVTGIGTGVEAFLTDQGHRMIHRVHFGGKAIESDKYSNKSAEMWARARDWLKSEELHACLPPDSVALQAELSSRDYSYDARRRLVLETKEHMRKSGKVSPNRADALVLTFASTVVAQRRNRVETLMEKLRRLNAGRKSGSPGMAA